ncbi:MAG: hypothetical protein ACRDTC_09140 [Pseudonocardiaceae bacterium]
MPDAAPAALAWTRNAADREYGFAQALMLRTPSVFAALEGGRICRSKAWLFTELCADLTDEQADAVCDRLLPAAGRLTTGELAARIKKLAIALDPDWAARCYATAVRERKVIGYLGDDGTATITGSQLPVGQPTAACAHVEELAKAAKRAGHPGRIGPLRADISLGLLDGRWQHMHRDEIIAELLAAANTEDRAQDVTADCAGAAGSSSGGGGVADRAGHAARAGSTPGGIPGWGPVTAEIARAVAVAQRGAEWRYAITDTEGQAAPRRPHPSSAPPFSPAELRHIAARPGRERRNAPARNLADRTRRPPRRVRRMGRGHRRHRRSVLPAWPPRAGPHRSVRWRRAASPSSDPGPILCLPGMPLFGLSRRPRPHDRSRLRRYHLRHELRAALRA